MRVAYMCKTTGNSNENVLTIHSSAPQKCRLEVSWFLANTCTNACNLHIFYEVFTIINWCTFLQYCRYARRWKVKSYNIIQNVSLSVAIFPTRNLYLLTTASWRWNISFSVPLLLTNFIQSAYSCRNLFSTLPPCILLSEYYKYRTIKLYRIKPYRMV